MAVRTSLFVFPPPGILALSLILQPSCPAPSNNMSFISVYVVWFLHGDSGRSGRGLDSGRNSLSDEGLKIGLPTRHHLS